MRTLHWSNDKKQLPQNEVMIDQIKQGKNQARGEQDNG